MILNNAPQNEAIVSNVGEIGEFRIRNSAKAFNILSSGLYANKIRAIIRELSTNAVDSHVAAGKPGAPFDVHLPNQLEPYFSIRDYGTGLSHDQVTNIYTTYFESTKTDSNNFIGALGLGSKSPFSYTDNFTVTAIQNGRRGVYTAFINEQGVPSIALMMQEDTDDAPGVEVKFSVSDRYDFDKFRQEARNVYKYFSLKPVVSGNSQFTFELVDYESRDIIPGVHTYKCGGSKSVAIMGNIAYPIEVPQADQSLGDLRNMLSCGLELHFGIGELDFQASREGLSYIPSTIEAIKRKLEAVNLALSAVIKREADAIGNLWDRAVFLSKKKEVRLWTSAVMEYAKTANLPTYDAAHKYGPRCTTFNLKVLDIAKDWNIQIKLLQQGSGNKSIKSGKSSTEYGEKQTDGHYVTWQEWHIPVDGDSHFLINDTKVGGAGRVGHHYRETGCKVHSRNLWIIEKADRNKDMDLKAFFTAIHNPPADRCFPVSELLKKDRESVAKNVTIMKLERRGGGGYRRSDDDMVWRDAGNTSGFDPTQTYYYVPLSGFVMESKKGYGSGKELYEDVKSLPGLHSGEIYGVRKKDIEDIKMRKNWVNFEDHIESLLNAKDISKLMMGLVKSHLDGADILNFDNAVIFAELDDGCPYKKFVSQFVKAEKPSTSSYRVESLFRHFAPGANLDPSALTVKYQAQLDLINRRYPLLTKLSTYRVRASDIAEYINMIDAKKGIE